MQFEVEKWGDGLGYPVDSGIKKAVIVWNLLECPTDSSCEGHLMHGEPFAWLRFSMINSSFLKNEKRILNAVYEKIKLKTKKSIGKKYGNNENLWSDKTWSEWNNFYFQTLSSCNDNKYEKALKKLVKENDNLKNKINKIFKEYTKSNTIKNHLLYKVNSFDYEHIVELVPRMVPNFKNKKSRRNFLKESREEMNKITEFLIKKYFN